MAKERTINELRQTKEYYTGNTSREDAQEVQNLNNNYFQWTNKANNSEEMKENRCPLDPVEEAKILIVDKITKHFSDFLFEMVNKEMGEKYVFQSQNYFTDAGYEQFEDEWFEFYHEHHGDIIYDVMQNITN